MTPDLCARLPWLPVWATLTGLVLSGVSACPVAPGSAASDAPVLADAGLDAATRVGSELPATARLPDAAERSADALSDLDAHLPPDLSPDLPTDTPPSAGPDVIGHIDAGDSGAAPDAAPAAYRSHLHVPLAIPVEDDGGTEADIADPHVIRVGDTFYLYATAPGHDFRVWTSADLVSWEAGGVVWEPELGSWNYLGLLWAPSVHPGDGGFYMYYTAAPKIGVAFSTSPTGPFEDVLEGPLVDAGLFGASIDAFLLEEPDGALTLYATWGPPGGLAAFPMTDYVTLAGGPVMVAVPGDEAWEGQITEAPWVVVRGGVYHLMFSGNDTGSNRYAVGVAVGESPLGPFERYPTNPILASVPELGIWGPGHHSLTTGPDGAAVIVFHAQIAPQDGWNRRIFLGLLDLTGELLAAVPPL